RALRQRQLLLILDNCEHLLAACAALASRLHRDCPQLTLLATSLQPLGLPAEIVWPVPPLALPDISTPATLANCDAVQLFLDRARRVQPGFDPTSAELGQIAAICRRLDGLPLAIELAAARARLLTPAQITTRLDDTFQLLTRGTTSPLPRHQTLQAAMDWSYQLLTAPQQALLRHLAVFGSGFNLAAAEAVFGQPNVLDLLADLVDRSLVLVTTPAGE
ncbi:MAG: AfsR/SARP family transcriptional regulator, partial [Anaerolineae bacterium]|nr:AfsR/SARP family transcriptional regulator [Anaerolineae bacterium]